MIPALLEANIPELALFRRGKVRDTFVVPHADGDRLLMVATDRLSAFDVILPTPIPGKGAILTAMAAYWFQRTAHIVPNHLISTKTADLPPAAAHHAAQLEGRMMLTRKAQRLDVECVVRGYLAGSGWQDYQRTGRVCGHALPSGLHEADRLPEPIFTPASKSDDGHDQNITVDEVVALIGGPLTERLRSTSTALYRFAAEHALARGIILADTKFEFGLIDGDLVLIDEVLTPDSSRFWDGAEYRPGGPQPSFDKQFVRDWLLRSGWNRQPPAPALPDDVVAGTLARYQLALERLTTDV